MIGSPAIGAFVALWGFWILLVVGWVRGELRTRGVVIFLLLWLAGSAVLRFVLYGLLFTPYVAVLDIGLVFTIFKGDVTLV